MCRLRAGNAFLLLLLSGAWSASARGQAPPSEGSSHPPHSIQDNSFLVEEAYNQDPGVVQHISLFTRTRGSGDWSYSFTQEWPAAGLTHQLSYSATVAHVGETGARGAGDTALNYRYQLLGDGEATVAIAPRLTVFLPTGDDRRGLGAGTLSYQVSIPASTVLSNDWIAHWNLGATWAPSARNPAGQRADATAWNAGASLIFLGSSVADVMLETVYSRFQTVAGRGHTALDSSWLVSPGIRWAYDFRGGLQIVPGVAFPIGFGPSRGSRQVLLYLSFEHPFRKVERASDP